MGEDQCQMAIQAAAIRIMDMLHMEQLIAESLVRNMAQGQIIEEIQVPNIEQEQTIVKIQVLAETAAKMQEKDADDAELNF